MIIFLMCHLKSRFLHIMSSIQKNNDLRKFDIKYDNL